MYKLRFNAITRELRFTNTNPPPYVDKFWKIRHMVKAWNYHMTSIFLAYWSIFLNKYISIWHSIWTFLGWIFCRRNPHLFGIEFHTDFYAFSGILFVVELVEGKAHPRQSSPLEFEYLSGKTLVLLLRMMKSYFSTGRYVLIGYSFRVLKGLIQLSEKGVFPCAIMNNRRYCPSVFPGKEMEDNFGELDVG